MDGGYFRIELVWLKWNDLPDVVSARWIARQPDPTELLFLTGLKNRKNNFPPTSSEPLINSFDFFLLAMPEVEVKVEEGEEKREGFIQGTDTIPVPHTPPSEHIPLSIPFSKKKEHQ